ncbi:MAG TPA: hypothetical protein VMJ65_14440 [Solirubrobacteraceae bacterium]|nr:hypothetical protein [Solirubrobacteraceae bacterium]
MDSHDFNSEVETRLREALFGTAMTGIEATGAAYPLGAFLLVGAMLDMLAGLMHAPASDSDRQQGVRYAAFVDRFFDDRYPSPRHGRPHVARSSVPAASQLLGSRHSARRLAVGRRVASPPA